MAVVGTTLEGWLWQTGDFRKVVGSARMGRRIGWVGMSRFEAPALEYLGHFRSARAIRPSTGFAYMDGNAAICAAISVGRYQSAIERARNLSCWPASASTSGPEWWLVRVNVSEALYNLGRWEKALEAIDGLEKDALGMNLAGLLNQRSWIFCHTGRATDALALHLTADRNGLPPIFYAEHHFTRALCLLELKRFDESAAELDVAETFAMRITSKRNLIYMRARLAMARGDFEAAEKLYRLGAKHPYRGQGGEALLAWGDCLVKLDRSDEARTAWELCVRRDPQSASAVTAQQRLGAAH